MNDRRKRAELRTSRLHALLEKDETGAVSVVSAERHHENVAQEIADRLSERLASRKPLRGAGKELLASYRSME
jgi:hypothetical protein